MPWRGPPVVRHETHPEFSWPAERLGFQVDDLFGDLHYRFNTVHMTIQEPASFHHDVQVLAIDSKDQDEFIKRLDLRRSQRLQELRDIQSRIWYLFENRPESVAENKAQMNVFRKMHWSPSFDRLTELCSTFLSPTSRAKLPMIFDLLPSDDYRARVQEKMVNDGWKQAGVFPLTPTSPSPRLFSATADDHSHGNAHELPEEALDDATLVNSPGLEGERKRKRHHAEGNIGEPTSVTKFRRTGEPETPRPRLSTLFMPDGPGMNPASKLDRDLGADEAIGEEDIDGWLPTQLDEGLPSFTDLLDDDENAFSSTFTDDSVDTSSGEQRTFAIRTKYDMPEPTKNRDN